jgi:uncharacterized protein (DUF4415 family)
MKKNPKYGVPDAENPEWTKEDFARSVPFSGLPLSLQEKLIAMQKSRGPQKEPTKVLTSIRLSPDVLTALRATGKGWQSRADEALRAWARTQARQPAAKKTARKAA